ncbi:MAG: DUF4430 domain-containing protein [Oscillospiraceae bacterium]|nr:DUF4430 domain-containing protein [Oscillospiraceae bacterium]
MRKRNRLLSVLLAALVLTACLQGCSAGGESKQPSEPPTETATAPLPSETPTLPDAAEPKETGSPAGVQGPTETGVLPANGVGNGGKEQTAKPATDTPVPENPQATTAGTKSYTCTVSISCATILDNMDTCDENKVELVPDDGWLLKPTTVSFQEGESAFDVLQRTCREKSIHMESSFTPIYNSAYIEGIGNIYEFDVGNLSGWMYHVNGWFPNYGCSRYQLQDGDEVAWVYTCDLGDDIGGRNVLEG